MGWFGEKQTIFGSEMSMTLGRRHLNVSLFLALLFSWLLASPMLFAQSPLGALIGIIQDTSGGRVAGATIVLEQLESGFHRTTTASSAGEFRADGIPPGEYRVRASANGFAETVLAVRIAVSSIPTVSIVLKPRSLEQEVQVEARQTTLASQPIETTSSVENMTVSAQDLARVPLAARSFANISYLTPMTGPVEPSDPTKARIAAVSFAGSSGLNVDLSVDGGDNNDDWIGGFLQNYSPDSIQEFAVRTAQVDADTSRTNGGSVIITTRRGTDAWHGSGAYYYRGQALNARNNLDNPAPNPKQPFSRQNAVITLGGPVKKQKLWFFSSLEYVDENASVAYSSDSLTQFHALASLAAQGLIPGLNSVSVPSSVPVPFRDTLFTTRVDWSQSSRSQWFFRGALDRNNTQNDLLQQGTLPSTGAATISNYYSFLIGQQFQFSPGWLGSFTFQANSFHNHKSRNSNLGFALAFPFTSTFLTTSGLETVGDNQFATSVTAFPIVRDQQKYQFRYDVTHSSGAHSVKFGVNVIHEPVLDAMLANSQEVLFTLPQNPAFYVANQAQFTADLGANGAPSGCPVPPTSQFCLGGNGGFSQSLRRLGVYVQDSWRLWPRFTVNMGLRYDTTFGLFRANGRDQNQNPTLLTLQALGIPLVSGIPHDYRGAVAPRLGIAYAPGGGQNTVIRAGIGLYYNDLAQNGWANALQAVNQPVPPGLVLPAGTQGALIDPHYHSPYALQASFGVEHAFQNSWRLSAQFEHQQGVHQYRRYEFVAGTTLPAQAPNVSLFRTDNRSRYDGVSFIIQHRFSRRFDLTAHYTLASASTWGATVGELFDYVNGVTDVRNPFGPGDHGPSGEDIRHRLVVSGVFELPAGFEVATLSQFESARPFTLATMTDLNNDGLARNDRAVINGVPTTLDQFRGTPFEQIDLRVSRLFRVGERVSVRPFVEFFNLLNRSNPGNNYISLVNALPPFGVDNPANATAICLSADCSMTRPIRSLNEVRHPAGALGDFFGPGTTVGIPFAAQLGVRFLF